MGIINEENKDNGSQIKNYSSMTIIAMILGICGLVLSCACIGMLPAMAGAVLSIITLVKGTKKKGIALIALVSSVLGIVIAVVVGIIAMFASDDTVNSDIGQEQGVIKDSIEEENDTVQVLGKNLTIREWGELKNADKVEFIGKYWAKRGDGSYIFIYKEADGKGNIVNVNIFATDKTTNKKLSELDSASHKDEKYVKIICDYDKMVINDDGMVHFYVTAHEAEILDPNSKEVKKLSGRYFYIGDTINLSGGVVYKVLSTGIEENFTGTCVYVEIEIENQGEEEYCTYGLNARFYGDGYQLTPALGDDRSFNGCELTKGRKSIVRFYAECPNYNQIGTIEVEFSDIADLVIVIKEEKTSNVGQSVEYLDLWNNHTMYIRLDNTYLEIYPIDKSSFFLAIRDSDGLDLRDLRFGIAENRLDANCLDKGFNLKLSVSSDGNSISVIQDGDIPYCEGMDFSGTYTGYSETPQ
ncbi:MAG: hypothetical protein E7287_00140 [Lachnospiraceae bacterium]|nr:hypothetical protein [Lachnospiraceae bacterium]